MNRLEGANCADLPGFVIDKYFDSDGARNPFHSQVAKAICSHCVVMEECRQQALNMAEPIKRGVIGGVTAYELRVARQWRRYELGLRSSPPDRGRPLWLERPDAVETVEQAWVEQDPDEPPIER